jgi:predicted nucleic acid-binding protein
MGAQGNEQGAESRFVLDAGALIGFERGSGMVSALLEDAEEYGDEVVIPASVLAQVWRGGAKAARLARLVNASEVDDLSESRAKEVGGRLGSRGGRDVVDAHAVCCAAERGAAIVTSDPDDTEALLEPGEGVELIRV